MRPLSVLVALFSLFAASACANGSASKTATPQPAQTASHRVLVDALLRPDDLGADWVALSTPGSDVEDYDFCGKKLQSFVPAAGAGFRRGQERVGTSESLTLLPDAAAAKAVVQKLRDAHSGCSDWVSTNGKMKTTGHTQSFVPVDIGDEAVMEQATIQFEYFPSQFVSYLVYVRRGSVVLELVEAGASNIDSSEPTRFARLALQRFVQATDGAAVSSTP